MTDGHLMTGSMIDLAFCVARKSPNERQKAGLCLRFSIFPTLLSVLTETRRLIFPEIEYKNVDCKHQIIRTKKASLCLKLADGKCSCLNIF